MREGGRGTSKARLPRRPDAFHILQFPRVRCSTTTPTRANPRSSVVNPRKNIPWSSPIRRISARRSWGPRGHGGLAASLVSPGGLTSTTRSSSPSGVSSRADGAAGVIVSNRFMSTRSGEAVRHALSDRFNVAHIWDFGDTKLFGAAVLPAVLLLAGKGSRPASPPASPRSMRRASTGTLRARDPIDALPTRRGGGPGLEDVSWSSTAAWVVRKTRERSGGSPPKGRMHGLRPSR